ncbi:MAG: fibronectin type III domain-containing protein [[Clostridium] innocuum]
MQGGILTATFNGTKDFKESATKASTTIGNASQDITTDMPSGLNVTEVSDNSMKISAKDGAVNYQFAYRKSGEAWTPVEASVTSGTVITMEGLDRNTTYEIGIRKSAKIGYDASGYRQMATAQTKKTRLNGLIDYVKVVDGADKPPKIGVAEVDQTYRATYHKGSYPQTAEDDKAGRWQWYYGDAPIEGATTDTYKISALLGNKEISVRYIATDSSDFTNEVIGRVGTLTKPVYDAPASLPTVTALDEDGEIRSKLKIENTGDIKAVYYFVQKASDQKVPNRIPAEDADKNTTPVEGKWFKATATVTLTLDADTDYVVYLAKLEDGSHQASGVVSQRAVRTKKEDLSKIPTAKITETNKDIWKVREGNKKRSV